MAPVIACVSAKSLSHRPQGTRQAPLARRSLALGKTDALKTSVGGTLAGVCPLAFFDHCFCRCRLSLSAISILARVLTGLDTTA